MNVNCCKTWGPDFKEARYHTDRQIFLRFRNFRLLRQNFFKLTKMDVFKSRLPFLGGDKFCSIYDVFVRACREFPQHRSQEDSSDQPFDHKNTLTCPAAYLFVEKIRRIVCNGIHIFTFDLDHTLLIWICWRNSLDADVRRHEFLQM